MKAEERAKYVSKTLDQYYPDPPRGFLRHKDPYTLLVAVVLSAQCTDAKVNQITPRLFAVADNPSDMSRQNVDDVAAIIRPCGLVNRKAPAIVELSRIIAEEYDGRVPETFQQLEALPGVGHKTASVVMCQAFGIPAFPVDTHIYRLGRRWKLSEGRSVEKVEADLKRLFPEKSWIKLHLQMILFGREYCSARGCNGFTCPICRHLNPR